MLLWGHEQSKDQGKDAVEHAEAVARLQGQLASTQEKAKKADEEAAHLRAAIKQMQDDLYSATAQLQTKVNPGLLLLPIVSCQNTSNAPCNCFVLYQILKGLGEYLMPMSFTQVDALQEENTQLEAKVKELQPADMVSSLERQVHCKVACMHAQVPFTTTFA